MLCICNTPWLAIIFKNKTTLALVSHTHQHSSADKPEDQPEEDMVMTLNIPNPLLVQVNGEDLPTTEEFTYLGSTVRCDGGAGNDVNNRFRRPKMPSECSTMFAGPSRKAQRPR